MIFNLINLAEKGLLPDQFIRYGIRKLCKERLNLLNTHDCELDDKNSMDWIKKLKNSPIAIVPEKANEQHYEVPPKFFEKVLGSNMKYSSGYWDSNTKNIDESEILMLQKTVNKAQINDGMKILELGCGWGSLTLHIAKNFPASTILAISNSKDQKQFIDDKCKHDNISNVVVETVDINNFNTKEKFDRVISIEMFEHMRNYQKLLNKINNLLLDNGKLFVHIFSHKINTYPFLNEGPGDWMAREFFSGGQMPSHNLFLHFQDDLIIEEMWRISGLHYSKTSKYWLKNMDKNKKYIKELFEKIYGVENSTKWFQRWRIFFMSCEELFGYNRGNDWGVSHYLFKKRKSVN
ncbi:MAG: SAM-dependent methyltransferase [Candidatus Marinimicrobia bacterium]|nr:SAM-dependent methyltransferase [Candidatus Neomarinimicrobiota bacterium]